MATIGREAARAPLTSADINDGIVTAADLASTLDLSSKTLTMPSISSLDVTGDLTVDTNTLYVDSANNRVGMGTTSPSSSLHVAGQIEASTDTTTPTGGSAYFYKSSAGATVSGFTTVIETGGAGSRQERMRIDSAGNVGIGTSSPGYKLSVSATSTISGEFRTSAAINALFLADAGTTEGTLYIGTVGNDFRVVTGSSERMRIDSSGNLLVGTTSAFTDGSINSGGSGALHIARDNERCLFLKRASSNGAVVEFFRGSISSPVGSISIDSSSTTYNTSSDYRLKNVDGPITNSGAYIDALKPVQGSWKADGSRFIGLIAHEVQEVSETQIATGEKDGEEMQGMDYSAPELIANLIAEIQSLRARVAQLEGA